MIAFVLKRLGFAVVTCFAVLTLVFFAIRILPGDPALVILGDQASAASIAALRSKLGLDQPVLLQYIHFVSGVPSGDWGTSIASGRPVIQEILGVLPSTIELTVASLIVGIVLGVPAGVWSAVHRNRIPDYLTRILSLLGLSAPAFVSGVILLLVFSVQLQWLPVISSGGTGTLGDRAINLVLPSINLGLIMAAYITRVTRSAMLEVLGQDYIRTAKAKGLSSRVVIYRHGFRNCLIPVVTVVGLYFGILLGNSVLTEIVFSRPGLGKLIVGALSQRDYPMLQGMIVIYTLIVVTVNLVTDLSYGFIDPRVKNK
ncbi:Dipeptide transport system permease protein dppB (ABC transporter) [Agrobacterium tumefaciens str. Kerr 14]|uniref:Dipeptide transport system permease protein dppB (ABC transporter) n=1 Tax=Agrobacterium tumefaciens str. Kerr 14 TaxID=1183424 RepID=A0A1S7SB33_AGRTU|nr:ABC transporter permease [Agrobacterium tumefaciens]CUX65717.1 Dipeptide transport system permease protein dppB (ABC transporter) [Agrobacterium tumefaciens str. Kerr 14]